MIALLSLSVAAKALPVVLLADAFAAAAAVSDQFNLLLNVATIVIAIGIAIPALKSRRKDATIKDLTDALEAKDERMKGLTESLAESEQQKRQIEQAAVHCQEQVARAEAKWEVAQRYTAQEAVESFEVALTAHAKALEAMAAVLMRIEEHVAR